jgi:hypothetical protein
MDSGGKCFIRELIGELGMNWEEIAKSFPERTAKSCKSHYDELRAKDKANQASQLSRYSFLTTTPLPPAINPTDETD